MKKGVGLGIVYLLTGPSLAARLVVSLYSLRRWYDGPVTVFTTRPASHEIGDLCAGDPRLRIHHSTGREVPGGSSSSYLTKIAILDSSPYRHTVFLDADTTVAGDLSPLLESAKANSLVATAFCGQRTCDDPVRTRLKSWERFAGKPDRGFRLRQRIDWALGNPLPTVNSGVFAIRSGLSFQKKWLELAWLGRTGALPDEIALQLLLLDHPHQLLGHFFNSHPFQYADDPNVRIWHFAARAHLRTAAARAIWLPQYRECVRNNIARIATWSRVEKVRKLRPVAI